MNALRKTAEQQASASGSNRLPSPGAAKISTRWRFEPAPREDPSRARLSDRGGGSL
jgi:hypothetical protein